MTLREGDANYETNKNIIQFASVATKIKHDTTQKNRDNAEGRQQ
jgi:hypothetical protein